MKSNRNLRRVNFFDRHVVKQEGADIHPGIQKLSVACVCGDSQHLWLGDRNGEVRRLDRQFVLSQPLGAFERELIALQLVESRQLLVALGVDTPTSGGTRYKIYDASKEDQPTMVLMQRVFPPRAHENGGTCLIANCGLSLMAGGIDTGVVFLWRARDLSQEKPWPSVLGEEGEPPVTAVHFLEQGRRTVLYACTRSSVRSWSIQDSDGEVRLLHVDTAGPDGLGGASECCSCIFPSTSALLVAKGDAVFAYDPDEGNMSAVPLEGDKVILERFKSYFVCVTSEDGAALGGTVQTPSAMPKQTITVVLVHPQMRFNAYQSQFTDVTHVTNAMGRIFVLSRGGADSNTVMFELREKDLSERLDILLKKRQFEWAAEVALQCGASGETVADIYRQHGENLFEKRNYDQALAVYMKTIDLGLPLEPSYIVERYLDAQRIGHVAKYLKRLHEKDVAEPEHTALLLKCYTKLKDFSTLQGFLETTPVSQYDPATAIEVLESAGYFGLAAFVAKKVGRNDDYVRVSLDTIDRARAAAQKSEGGSEVDVEEYTKIVEFLKGLPRMEAGRILLAHGRALMKHVPAETVALVREFCGLESAVLANEERPRVDDFLPVFFDDEAQLEQFLRGILLTSGGVGSSPLLGADRLYATLLELMVRSYHAAEKALQADPSAAEEAAHQKQQQLHKEIMTLIRQNTSEDALCSALLLCQTYAFVDGFFHAAERLGRYQLLLRWCFEKRDAKRLVQVCKRCGPHDQSLWVQALSFLASDGGDHVEEIGEVLKHIEESDLMPLLMVIETLQQSPKLTVGDVRSYMQGQFRKLVESVETSRGKARQDKQEILRMQQEILSLRTQAQVFQNTKCFQCGLTLEVPAVHFFCGHSYHSYCVPADGRCSKCSSEALPKITLKEQREAQARNTEDFFKYIQGGGGEGGVQAIGDWCKFGAFDAGGALNAAGSVGSPRGRPSIGGGYPLEDESS